MTTLAKRPNPALLIVDLTILAISLAALAGDARASEPPGTNAFHARLHWSAPTKIVSPDLAWELAVFPAYDASENSSPVVVRKRGGGRANVVLDLERNANIYWGSESRLLILDHGITNPPRILLFRLGATGDVTRIRTTPDLDADIRGRLLGTLGRSEAVPFYVPTLESWTGSRLVLMLGGTVVYRTTAPSMVPYCYRVTLDSRTAKVESMAKESARYGATKCQVFRDDPSMRGRSFRTLSQRGTR
jgi:hypothetical protein